MKIAVSGTHCTGKSTYIKDFLKTWTNYTSPEKSYRDYIKEQDLPHSKEGTEESQQIILNALIDQAQEYSKNDNVIFDRCILDNLAYSSWLNLNGKVSDKFLDESRILIREALKTFDVIFFVPLTKVAPVDFKEDELRDNDLVYREEIDNIFKVFLKSFHQGDGRVFATDDAPPIIEIFGNPIERVEMTKLYITEEGQPYGEDKSLISDIYTGI
jgi:predicted ATPase